VIAFSNQEAGASVTGWVRRAAESFGVTLITAEVPDELREEIKAAQDGQLMVSKFEVVDDV
jgi:hypothetical protein